MGDMRRIPQDKVKYVAMCNDDGCLIDDGVIVRPGEEDYYFTTTTGRAGQTLEWFRYHTRYEDWDYHLVNLTDTYGAVNLAGPRARVLLEKLTDADLPPPPTAGTDRIEERDAFGRTPLMEAIERNFPTWVDYLIGAGARLDESDPLGNTALHFAILNGNRSLTERLLDAGADPNATTQAPRHRCMSQSLPMISTSCRCY